MDDRSSEESTTDDASTDGAHLRPVDEGFDPAEQEAVRLALRRWSSSLTSEPLAAPPPEVWSRISAAISADSADSADSTSSPARHVGRLRALPGGRWTTPLVAASVVGLAMVIGANVLGSGESAPGGGESIVAEASRAVADPIASSPQVLQAGFVPPARKVMQLGEDLTSANVARKVDELLEDAGVDEPMDVLAMPTEEWQPSPDGLTSDPQVLRACVTKVTKVDTSQALLVLRASVNGIDAGLIVVPEFMQDMNQVATMDADDMRRMGAELGSTTIYVVEPTCGLDAPDHDPTLFTFTFTIAP